MNNIAVYVPNAFTPDENQYNTVFYPVFSTGFSPINFEFSVFNRWGEEVFSSTNLNFVWDGTYEGIPVQVGTYTWYLVYEIEKGIYKDLSGHVNVIR